MNSGFETAWAPLVLAAYHGQTEVVRSLLASGADPSQKSPAGWSALMHAINGKFPEVAAQLIKAGCDVNAREPDQDWTALCLAAFTGDLDTTKRLLEKGADASAQTTEGWTPLTLAIQHKHEKVALALQKAVARSK